MTDAELEAARQFMVRKQLRNRGIRDHRVLAAMAKVPRDAFLDPELRELAYADRAVTIDCGQTISQPYIVALMTESLELSGGEKVLEVGTGSGYQTAVLAELGARVCTIERHSELSQRAEAILGQLGYRDVRYMVGDGTLGWPSEAPFDRIVVTAAAQRLPQHLFEQLAEGGILTIPLGAKDVQTLEAIRRVHSQPQPRYLSACRFVPLVGEAGWPE